MVARSVFEVSGYTPADEPRIAASLDGNLVAVADASRIVVLELATGTMLVEIDPAVDVVATEIGWLGTPPQLLVLSASISTASISRA